jgi:hypothetical protein
MINVTDDPYIPNWRANVSHYGTNETLRPGDENTTVCTTCHKIQGAGGGEYCTAGLTDTDRAKWGNARTVTMGNCDVELCWTCHVTWNEDLKAVSEGGPVNPYPPSSTFHGSDIDNFMWNCQRCHPE